MKNLFLLATLSALFFSACSEDTQAINDPKPLQTDITKEQPKVQNSDNLPPVPPTID